MKSLNILVVGQSARDHALVATLARSPLLGALHVAPGNPSMEPFATRHAVVETDFDGLVELALQLKIDLVVVAFEDLLVNGIAEHLQAAGITCLGPSAAAAQIEGSKAFAKQVMHSAGVPTPASSLHTDLPSARVAIADLSEPVVIKADGLAGGRGAFICATHAEAIEVAASLLEGDVFGGAGTTVIVEEFVTGHEASLMVLCDGEHLLPLPAVRDFKRLRDNDLGPNTGGMGACSPPPSVTQGQIDEAIDIVVRPAVREMARRGTPFQGVLYAGVMMTDRGPLALEYNCRFGNPETQVLVRLLDSDLLDLLYRTATHALEGASVRTRSGAAVGVCIASAHYPELEVEAAPVEVLGMAAAAAVEGVEVFAGPTDLDFRSESVHARGGRVCTVTAVGETMEQASERAYEACSHIRLQGASFRRDIGVGEPALR